MAIEPQKPDEIWFAGMVNLVDHILRNAVDGVDLGPPDQRIITACRTLDRIKLRLGVRDEWPLPMNVVNYYSGMYRPGPVPPPR